MRLLLLMAMLLCLVGCEKKKTPTTPVAPPTPQERFDRVVGHMRSDLEGEGYTDSGNQTMISDRAGVGSITMDFQVDASPKISKSASGEDRYSAIIKVTLKTSYTSRRHRPTEEQERKKDEKTPPNENRFDDLFDGRDGDSDPEIFDSDLIGEMPDSFEPSSDNRPRMTFTQTHTAVESTTYKLEYRENRWILAVPPPHDALQSANGSLRRALKRQR